ncbi:hypothetical protein [Luteibacter anthropi]|uniref:hypothetical protein n=1 Tax=Luteibacter anthropi TaxID=564369 RepID=UPI0020330D45|nr:hypothetical protein [Luteibacter anthropi]
MHRLATLFFMAVLGVAILSACRTAPAASQPVPVAGFVTDIKAFDAFIGTHPTAAQFHAAYPDVLLVMPNTATTMEIRMNNSRYFPQFDADGRITGGRFQ